MELVGDAFEFLRLHTRQLTGLAAVVVLPVQLFVAYISRSAYEGHTTSVILNNGCTTAGGCSDLGPSGLVLGASFLADVLTFFSLSLVAGPVARMVAAYKVGRPVSAWEAARLPARAWLSLVVACLFVHLCEFAGLVALGVGAGFAMVMFAAVSPVVVLEEAGPFRAMGRAWRMSLRRFGPVLGAVLAASLVTDLFSNAVGTLPTVLPQFVGFTGGWVLAGAGEVCAKMIGFTVTASFSALLYIDLRVQTEGMDLVLALTQ